MTAYEYREGPFGTNSTVTQNAAHRRVPVGVLEV